MANPDDCVNLARRDRRRRAEILVHQEEHRQLGGMVPATYTLINLDPDRR
jgi:hypothetical protein